MGILDEPPVEFRTGTAIRRPRPGKKLNSRILRRFAQHGLGARDAVRAGGLLELPTAGHNRNTWENRVVVAFIDLLRRRIERSLKRAKAKRDMRVAKLSSYGPDAVALMHFVQRREHPKITRLQEIVDASEQVLTEMHRAVRNFSVPVKQPAAGISNELRGSDIQEPPHHSRAALLMRGFLRNTSIIVEQGDGEGAKSIETIFEQWFFFQVSAALHAAGLYCISHSSIFEPIARDRFSVDLDRNAAISFEPSDNRIVRVRYEPTILPREAAQGMESLYRGKSASPWTPDIVLEILVPSADLRDYRLAYAAVIDAKYTTSGKVWDRLQKIENIARSEVSIQIVKLPVRSG